MHNFYAAFGLILFVAAGCSSPSPKYAKSDAVEINVGERMFHVYSDEKTAQAIRMNREWGAKPDNVKFDAVTAIELATGCKVDEKSPDGDSVVVNARISCG